MKNDDGRMVEHIKYAKCPNCGCKTFDGDECFECGFDAFCFDPDWG